MSLALGYEGAERAAASAGAAWKEEAYAAFLAYAKEHDTFTTEQARQASHVSEPPDRRAWGQVALRAAREGVVRKRGFARAEDVAVHGNIVTEWESLICV